MRSLTTYTHRICRKRKKKNKKLFLVVFVLVMVMFVVQHTLCIVVVSAKTINNCAQISWTKEISFGYTNVTTTTNSDVFIALMNKVKIIREHRHRTIKVSKDSEEIK